MKLNKKGGEKILPINKTKFQQVCEVLDREGYLSDTEAVKIWGNEEGIYKSLEHVRIWKKLNADRDFFADKKIIEKKKGYRTHLVRTADQPKDQYYKVGKEFYNSLPKKPLINKKK